MRTRFKYYKRMDSILASGDINEYVKSLDCLNQYRQTARRSNSGKTKERFVASHRIIDHAMQDTDYLMHMLPIDSVHPVLSCAFNPDVLSSWDDFPAFECDPSHFATGGPAPSYDKERQTSPTGQEKSGGATSHEDRVPFAWSPSARRLAEPAETCYATYEKLKSGLMQELRVEDHLVLAPLRSFPDPAVVNIFTSRFTKCFLPQAPATHVPTFNFNAELPQHLLVTIISIGVTYCRRKNAKHLATVLQDRARCRLQLSIEADNTMLRSPHTVYAAALICYAGIWCGNKRAHELAEAMRSSVVTWLRWIAVTTERIEDDGLLDACHSWAQEDSCEVEGVFPVVLKGEWSLGDEAGNSDKWVDVETRAEGECVEVRIWVDVHPWLGAAENNYVAVYRDLPVVDAEGRKLDRNSCRDKEVGVYHGWRTTPRGRIDIEWTFNENDGTGNEICTSPPESQGAGWRRSQRSESRMRNVDTAADRDVRRGLPDHASYDRGWLPAFWGRTQEGKHMGSIGHHLVIIGLHSKLNFCEPAECIASHEVDDWYDTHHDARNFVVSVVDLAKSG
ncbi:uncharacterized protein MYCFIDRAFT_173677 [Pseudocercospora fijiensis CIRAD86]|uniref:Transcription factor domain-containing protein n=1 Tax=Pseudocercospora fijiensis (strain CIRAD86) TaxID=383855 RepID=M3AJM1_PSEFD|nr:uncharacterized protein MYCFIDRAFT_173677 [Pseudocercospora fijiensis CIRAD86]EME84746.1 hypothetical protein MYCFIDRAFT_173677 [Pseudocercospora fijiensis CIRAD86]